MRVWRRMVDYDVLLFVVCCSHICRAGRKGREAEGLTAESLPAAPASSPLPPASCEDATAGRVPKKAWGEGRGAARRRGWECEMPCARK